MNLSIATFLTLLVNLPFGYWRANYQRFTLKWFLLIHLPIPFIVFFRYSFNVGFAFYTYPIMVSAFFIGQLAGKKINLFTKKRIDN